MFGIDFSPLDKGAKVADLQENYTREDLIAATNASIDMMLDLIKDATDEIATFIPHDPDAHDPFAEGEPENVAWNLAHVIVHATASGEETAALGATLARGVKAEWRNRYETDWETVTTAAQLHERLEESRRMRLSYFEAWPNAPHLDVKFDKLEQHFGALNACGYALLGLKHDSDHIGQITEIMRQGREKFLG